MKNRAYEFVTGIETATQPDAGTPTLTNDLVTLGYISGLGVGAPLQEVPAGAVDGANTTFTLSQTPTSAAQFRLYINGLKAIEGVDFTRVTVTITTTVAPAYAETIEADYNY